MAPYRANMGGIFSSGLYPKQPPAGNAGDIIDAVTRGASTLIESAYARKLKEREQAREDAQLALAQRTADRADSHDAWERSRATIEDERKNRQEERADFESGYTPKKTTTKAVVEPGSVTTNGLLGAPGKVTAPRLKQEKLTIPSAYNFMASKAGQEKKLEIDRKELERGEHMTDAKKLIDYREQKRAQRPNRGATTDSPTVHAAAAIKSQIAEADTRIKTLQAKKFAPGVIAGDDERQQARDDEVTPLIARRDSLQRKYDAAAGKLTDEAGLGTTRGDTIRRAYTGTKFKANGSTIRGSGEAADHTAPVSPAAKKSNGETVRHPGKQVITRAEAQALQQQGFDSTRIAHKYIVQ
jgi:hypothetical protein